MLLTLLLSCLAAADFAYVAEEAEISAEIRPAELKAHVYRLSGPEFLGRRGDGADRAAEHLAERFRKLPLKPAFGDSYFQPIPWLLTSPRADGKTVIGRNVGAYLPGSDPQLAGEWIILAAHYDHLGIRHGKLYPGADDNASGVAMLLEVAEAMALTKDKPKRSVYFISFDHEEDGLQGSTHFAAHPPREFSKLKAFLVADILGRSMADVMEEYVFALGSEHSPQLRALLKSTTSDPIKVGRIGADVVGTRSDYGPFRDRKVPFLFFTTGTHRDYHQPTDLPDRLDYEKLARISRWIAELTVRIADAAESPRWAGQAAPELAEVEVVKVLFDRALERSMVVPMTPAQRKQAAEARDRLGKIIAAKEVTAADRDWLIATARWAMLNLF